MVNERAFFSFSLDARPGYKILKAPISIMLKKVNKDTIDEIVIYLEDDDGHQVTFNGESLTFSVKLMKKQTIFISSK